MRTNNTFWVIAFLITFVFLGVAFSYPPRSGYKNLQVLPKDISEQMLDSIMSAYNVALGVNCKFCHVPFKHLPDSLDYASDVEPMKKQAREMIRMTILINKTYFYFNEKERPEYLKVVTCNTCHRGEAFPEQ